MIISDLLTTTILRFSEAVPNEIPLRDMEVVDQYLPQIQILQEQITYLKSVNESLKITNDALNNDYKTLTQAFNSFTATVTSIFGIASGVIAILTSIGGFLGFKSIEPKIDAAVNNQVEQAIASKIGERVEKVEKIIEQERVLEKTTVSYYIPNSASHSYNYCSEFKFLGEYFDGRIKVVKELNKQTIDSNILILDLENSDISTDDSIDVVKKIDKIIKAETVLVIYISDNISPAVNFLRNSEEIQMEHVAANSKVTLIARVIDAAYAANALKH